MLDFLRRCSMHYSVNYTWIINIYWIEAENEELAVATVHSHFIQVDRVYELLLLSTDIPKKKNDDDDDDDEAEPSFSAYRMKKPFIISETMFVTFANHSIRLFRTQKPQRTRSLNETNFPFDFTECTTSHNHTHISPPSAEFNNIQRSTMNRWHKVRRWVYQTCVKVVKVTSVQCGEMKPMPRVASNIQLTELCDMQQNVRPNSSEQYVSMGT